MKPTALLPILLIFVQSALFAQVTMRGTVINAAANRTRQLSLESWSTDHWQQVSGATINQDNTFSLKVEAPAPGQYRFRMFGEAKVWADFIIPDSTMADSVLVFNMDYLKMDGSPAPTVGSRANALYFDLITAHQKLTNPDKPEGDWGEFNKRCNEIIKQHRKSLLGDIALLLYEPRKEDYPAKSPEAKMTANEFVKAHALDKIPFEHDNVLRHNAFAKQMNRYFNYFENTEAGGNAFIDGIMARRNGNEFVDGYVFRYLLDKLMDSKNDASLSYLLKWYTPDCPDDDPQPSYIQNLIVALKACAPGSLAPDLNFNNLEGQVANLGQVCAKNKLTMLLFWRSTCSHCKEFEPELEELYKKYHPLGLEVYALSSDKSEEFWRGALQTQPTPWINVFIPKEQRNEIGRQFPAPSTPTIIVLDRNRKVVSRVLSRGNLGAYLDGELAKRK